MRVRVSKSIVAGLAALIVSIGVSVAPTPAAAQWHGGGFHGGFGGGFHGGGFGGWRGGWGWRRGWGWGPGWGYAAWYPWWGWGYPWWGWGYGPGWGPDYAGGYYGGGDSGCWTYRRVWTRPGGKGRYLGRRLVNVCG